MLLITPLAFCLAQRISCRRESTDWHHKFCLAALRLLYDAANSWFRVRSNVCECEKEFFSMWFASISVEHFYGNLTNYPESHIRESPFMHCIQCFAQKVLSLHILESATVPPIRSFLGHEIVHWSAKKDSSIEQRTKAAPNNTYIYNL